MTARPAFREGEVHVWKASLDGPEAELRSLSRLLSPDERERASKFHFDKDKARFARCRAFLRTILGGYLDADPGTLKLSYNGSGKPGLDGPPGAPEFNLSHSEGMALFAFSLRGPIGIDLERLRPVPDAQSMVEAYFSAAEKSYFRGLAPARRDEAFLSLWTRKEAYLKACGEGLGRPLDEDPDPAQGWTIRGFAPAPGFVAAVAQKGELGRLSLLDWPPAEVVR